MDDMNEIFDLLQWLQSSSFNFRYVVVLCHIIAEVNGT